MMLLPDPNDVARGFGQGPMPVARGPKQSFGQKLLNRFMPRPDAGGLLSEEDISNARRQGLLGLGLSLLSAGGPRPAEEARGTLANIADAAQQSRAGYDSAIDRALGTRVGLDKLGMEKEAHQQTMATNQFDLAAAQAQQAQQQQIMAGRAAIIKEHPMPETTGRMAEWVEEVFPKFVALGDDATVQRLAAIRATLGSRDPGTWVTQPGPDGKPVRRYVTAEEAGAEGVPVYEKPQRDTNEAMTINSRFMNEQRLEKQYADEIEGVQTTVDAYVSAKRAAEMGGSGDLQILYSFIRALDPNSVVREGEIALARQAASLWSQAHVLKNKLETKGGTLSPVQRKQMIELMKQMVELKAQRTDAARKNAEARAERFGLNVYLRDPLEAYHASEKGTATPAAPTPNLSPNPLQQMLDTYGGLNQ